MSSLQQLAQVFGDGNISFTLSPNGSLSLPMQGPGIDYAIELTEREEGWIRAEVRLPLSNKKIKRLAALIVEIDILFKSRVQLGAQGPRLYVYGHLTTVGAEIEISLFTQTCVDLVPFLYQVGKTGTWHPGQLHLAFTTPEGSA